MKRELKEAISLSKGALQTLAFRALRRRPKLRGMVYEITDLCNSRCRHCSIWRQKPAPNPLTPAEIEKIFQDPFFRNLKEVIITGGEPMVRPDLEEIVFILRKYIHPDAIISLSTNGILPERAIKAIKTFLAAGMRLVAGVSLDGIGQKHDEIRGIKGNFQKVDFLLHELKLLQNQYKDSFSVTAGFTFSPLTFGSMEEVKNYVESFGFYFLPQVYEEVSYYSNENGVRSDKSEELIKAIQEFPPSFQKEMMLMAVKGLPFKFSCSSMNTFFLLHSNGDISPCLRYSHLKLGNLKNQSIEEIWQSKAVKDARKMIKNCNKCYNTWATGWSMETWFPPFLPLLAKVYCLKKKSAKSKKQ
ncbi:MAG: radical SAM protein [bacterium]